MELQVERRYTIEEYAELEAGSEIRHEFYGGRITALAGGSFEHSAIKVNVTATLHAGLRGKPCRALNSDMRVRTPSGLYAYPDVLVVCGRPELAEAPKNTLLNPVVIVEVLSDSTASYDRGLKFVRYRSLPTLRDYVLIEQDRVHVEHFRKEEAGLWVLREYDSLEDAVSLVSVGVELSLANVYEKAEPTAIQG